MERMDDDLVVSSILLCDLVTREEGTGKYSIIGTFQGFNAPRLPFVARFIVFVALTNFVKTPKELTVTVNITDSKSAHVIASVSGNMPVKDDVSIPRNAYLEVPVPFPQVMFQTAGEFKVEVLVNTISIGYRYLAVQTQTANPLTSS